MNQELVKSIGDTFTLIATQAGVIVERLWIILTKQQFLYGLKQALYGAIVIGLGLWFARMLDALKTNKSIAKVDKKFLMVVFFITGVGAVFWGASLVIDSMPRLFNPEYYSIRDAVDLLQKVK